MTREAVKDKIRKLIAHEKSARKIGNAAEAKAYARHVARLCKRHSITRRSLTTPPAAKATRRPSATHRPASPRSFTKSWQCSCGARISITFSHEAIGLLLQSLNLGAHIAAGHELTEMSAAN
jgi:hypothetical protein